MRTTRYIATGTIVCGSFLIVGGHVFAEDVAPAPVGESDPSQATPPVAVSSGAVTLPLLGAGLLVDLETDAGGGLVGVALNPAADYTATSVKPNHVAFENTDGTVTVYVAQHRGSQQVSAKTDWLADIVGPGQWTGDVFGSGETTTVEFTIGTTAEGGPDITGVAAQSTATVEVGETTYDNNTRRGGQRAVSVVKFTAANGQERTLWIVAKAGTHDGQEHASLQIGLGRTHGRDIVEGEAVGAHTWNGTLCDGEAASISYVVAEDGTLQEIVATPEAEVRGEGDKVLVKFDDGEAVKLRVRDGDDGALVVSADDKIRCDRVDPTVNTEIAPDADKPDPGNWGDWHGDKDHGGWGRGDGRGDRDGKDGWGGDRDDGGNHDGDHDGRDGDRDGSGHGDS